jgi:hypothetical protein
MVRAIGRIIWLQYEECIGKTSEVCYPVNIMKDLRLVHLIFYLIFYEF